MHRANYGQGKNCPQCTRDAATMAKGKSRLASVAFFLFFFSDAIVFDF